MQPPRRDERRQRPGRVFHEEVAIGDRAVDDSLAVVPVESDVARLVAIEQAGGRRAAVPANTRTATAILQRGRSGSAPGYHATVPGTTTAAGRPRRAPRPLGSPGRSSLRASGGHPPGGARGEGTSASGAAGLHLRRRRPATPRASTPPPATSSPPGTGSGRRSSAPSSSACSPPGPARSCSPAAGAATSRSPWLLSPSRSRSRRASPRRATTPARPSSAGRCSGRCRCSSSGRRGSTSAHAWGSHSGCRSSCSRS